MVRVTIGWHLCYEGLTRLLAGSSWSAGPYLESATGWFAGVFHRMAAHAGVPVEPRRAWTRLTPRDHTCIDITIPPSCSPRTAAIRTGPETPASH